MMDGAQHKVRRQRAIGFLAAGERNGSRGAQTAARPANEIETFHSRFVKKAREGAHALVQKGSRHDICLLKMLARR